MFQHAPQIFSPTLILMVLVGVAGIEHAHLDPSMSISRDYLICVTQLAETSSLLTR